MACGGTPRRERPGWAGEPVPRPGDRHPRAWAEAACWAHRTPGARRHGGPDHPRRDRPDGRPGANQRSAEADLRSVGPGHRRGGCPARAGPCGLRHSEPKPRCGTRRQRRNWCRSTVGRRCPPPFAGRCDPGPRNRRCARRRYGCRARGRWNGRCAPGRRRCGRRVADVARCRRRTATMSAGRRRHCGWSGGTQPPGRRPVSSVDRSMGRMRTGARVPRRRPPCDDAQPRRPSPWDHGERRFPRSSPRPDGVPPPLRPGATRLPLGWHRWSWSPAGWHRRIDRRRPRPSAVWSADRRGPPMSGRGARKRPPHALNRYGGCDRVRDHRLDSWSGPCVRRDRRPSPHRRHEQTSSPSVAACVRPRSHVLLGVDRFGWAAHATWTSGGKRKVGDPVRDPPPAMEPAATYSPRANPPKYHRRWRA